MERIIIPTAFFPPVAYMAATMGPDEICIQAGETYRKQTCRTHCVIAGPNGKQVLSIPVHKPGGNHTKTGEVLISYEEPWQSLHWRSIESAYNKSPFFLYYRDEFEPFFLRKTESLIEFNSLILKKLFKILRMEKIVTLTEEFDREASEHSEILVSKHHRTATPQYTQVFSDRQPFHSNLSILDCIFNLGPETGEYLTGLR